VARSETLEKTKEEHSTDIILKRILGGEGTLTGPIKRDTTEPKPRVPIGEDRMNEAEAEVKTTTGVAVAEAVPETKAGPEMDKTVITMTTIAKSAIVAHLEGVLEEVKQAAGEETAGDVEQIKTLAAVVATVTTSRGMLRRSLMRMLTTPDWSPACVPKMTAETMVMTPEMEVVPPAAGVLEDVELVAVLREPAAEVVVAAVEASQEAAIIIRETEP